MVIIWVIKDMSMHSNQNDLTGQKSSRKEGGKNINRVMVVNTKT